MFFSADTNNASLYDVDDVSSGQQVTSVDAGWMSWGAESVVTSWSDDVTTDVAAAADEDDDVMMASLLCVGAAVCATSLGALVFLAARRRLRVAGDKRVVVPVSAARRLLAVTAAAGPPTAARHNSYYVPQHPQPASTTILYSDKWSASHVTAMRLLFTGHQSGWAATADTCFV